MTGKRFTLTNPKNAFQEMKCGINDMDKTLTFNEVINLLNEQHEQIKCLKELISTYEDMHSITMIQKLEKENEQLNSRIQYLENKIQREQNATTKQQLKWSKEAETKIKELSEENEQLKQQVDDLDGLLNNYQITFEELEEILEKRRFE